MKNRISSSKPRATISRFKYIGANLLVKLVSITYEIRSYFKNHVSFCKIRRYYYYLYKREGKYITYTHLMILYYYSTFLSMQDSDNINLFNKIAYTITFYKNQCSKGQA